MNGLFFLLLAGGGLFTAIPSEENQTAHPAHLQAENLSMTDFYLMDHPLETIKSVLAFKSVISPDQFEKHLPLIEKIIKNEKKTGFIGYHGSSQQFRIFQDILRAVFVEVLDYEIPDDFLFLRIPGDELFDLKNGKFSFFDLFDRKEASEDLKKKIIKALLIDSFNLSYGCSMKLSDFSKNDTTDLWSIVTEFLEMLDSLAKADYEYYEFEDDKYLYALSPIQPAISKNLNMHPVHKRLHSMLHFLDSHDQTFLDQLESLLPNVAQKKIHEIFMRILKTMNKKVNAHQVAHHISLSFQFRDLLQAITNLSYQDESENLWKWFFPYSDHIPEQQSRLISLNVPLFGNFHRLGDSSFRVFSKGTSLAGGDNQVIDLLIAFFDKIGLDKNLPKELRNIAATELKNAKNTNGCILQFFDLSERNGKPPHQGTNNSTYVSHAYGIPLKNIEPSQLLLNHYPIKRNDFDLQLRMIPSNSTTLNPYSFLQVLRYDSLDPKISIQIIDKMRTKLKSAIVDIDKLNAYKAEINSLWN